jgi:uncharacterized lipoprotein YddW (UPF0748 family)
VSPLTANTPPRLATGGAADDVLRSPVEASGPTAYLARTETHSLQATSDDLLRAPRSRRAAPASLALLAGAAALAACGGDASPVAPTPDLAPRLAVGGPDVRIMTSDAVMLVRTPSAEPGARGGTSLQLQGVLLKRNGKLKEKDQQLTWTSTVPSVASVDLATGLVTALDTGATQVIVDYKDRSADTVRIVVIPVPVARVTIAGVDSISLGDTTRFEATALDSAGAPLLGRPVAWRSSVPAVAELPDTTVGEVLARTVGKTSISATIGEATAGLALRVAPQPVATVTVTLADHSLPQFRRMGGFTAVLHDRRGNVLTGRTVTWSSSDTAVIAFTTEGDSVVARDVGTANVVATAEAKRGAAAVTVTNPVEARALWVTRFEYTGPSSVDFAKIATIMQKAASARFNVVYFQVRTAGDALYYSDLEPCSPRMCGSLGGPRPSQDPLVVALREAAKHGIQVHAWLNAYTGFISGSAIACNQFIASTPANWLKAHPDWSVSTKSFATGAIARQVDNCLGTPEYMWVSPGVPEVRAQLATVSADIARRYGPLGLRGIHLDRIRYPSNQVSYDPATQEAFKAKTGAYPTSNAQAAWLDFRREVVNEGVREVHDAVRAVDPGLVISAAVFPGYKPRTGWAAQWSFTDLFQDPQAWAQGGYLDVEVPMNYPATAASTSWTVKATYCSNLDWTCVMDDHIARIEKGAGRQVYVGVGAIKGWDETKRQIDLAHDRVATGVSVYSFSQVDAIPNGWALLAAGPFKNPATVPAMAWKSGSLAQRP